MDEFENQSVDTGTDNQESTNNDADESFEAWLARESAAKSEDKTPPKSTPKDNQFAQDDQSSDEEESTEESNEEADQTPKEKEEPAPKSYIVKAYGEEWEVEEKDVPQLLSKAIGADRVFKESAELKKSAQQFVEDLKADPFGNLERMGVDVRRAAEAWLWEKIQYERMDENQRKAVDNERELKKYKAQEEATRKAQEEATRKAKEEEDRKQSEQHHNNYRQQIEGEIKKMGLSPDPQIMAMFARYMQVALQNGKDVHASEVTAQVQADLDRIAEAARKRKVEEFKQQQQQKPKPTQAANKKDDKPKKRITSIYQLLD